jgi:hypothetical protein
MSTTLPIAVLLIGAAALPSAAQVLGTWTWDEYTGGSRDVTYNWRLEPER